MYMFMQIMDTHYDVNKYRFRPILLMFFKIGLLVKHPWIICVTFRITAYMKFILMWYYGKGLFHHDCVEECD